MNHSRNAPNIIIYTPMGKCDFTKEEKKMNKATKAVSERKKEKKLCSMDALK